MIQYAVFQIARFSYCEQYPRLGPEDLAFNSLFRASQTNWSTKSYNVTRTFLFLGRMTTWPKATACFETLAWNLSFAWKNFWRQFFFLSRCIDFDFDSVAAIFFTFTKKWNSILMNIFWRKNSNSNASISDVQPSWVFICFVAVQWGSISRTKINVSWEDLFQIKVSQVRSGTSPATNEVVDSIWTVYQWY